MKSSQTLNTWKSLFLVCATRDARNTILYIVCTSTSINYNNITSIKYTYTHSIYYLNFIGMERVHENGYTVLYMKSV